eukprot:jgi/Hompol1/1198/HPOL_004845-RA
MIFAIYTDEAHPDRFTEAYTFSFSYPDKNRWCISLSKQGRDEFSFKTREDVTRATCDMLRRLLILTQTLEPLPQRAFLTMKLMYYDSTPQFYEPPNFCAGADLPIVIDGPSQVELDVGSIASPYHSLQLKVNHAAPLPFQKEEMQTESVQSGVVEPECESWNHNEPQGVVPRLKSDAKEARNGNNDEDLSHGDDDRDTMDTQELISALKLNTGSSVRPLAPIPSLASIKPDTVIAERVSSDYQSGAIACPCGINDSEPRMIQCRWCKVLSHPVCLGFLPSADIPSLHTCTNCTRSRVCSNDKQSDSQGSKSVDPDQKVQLRTALIRRAIFRIWPMSVDHIGSVSELSRIVGMAPTFAPARQLANWLVEDGFLQQVDFGQSKQESFLKKRYKNAITFEIVRTPSSLAQYNRMFSVHSSSRPVTNAMDITQARPAKRDRSPSTQENIVREVSPDLVAPVNVTDNRSKKRKVSVPKKDVPTV